MTLGCKPEPAWMFFEKDLNLYDYNIHPQSLPGTRFTSINSALLAHSS